MKKRSKGMIALFVFLLVGVMFSSSTFTALTPVRSKGLNSSANGEIVASSGTTGINTVEEYVNTDLAEDVPTINADEKISLIVEMSDKALIDMYNERRDEFDSYQDYIASPSGKIAADNLKAAQRAMYKKIKAKVDVELEYQYVGVMNAFSIEIVYKDRDKIDAVADKVYNTFIAERYDVPQYTIVTNEVTAYKTGIFDASDTGFPYQGEGMVVAILDTGLEFDHPAFSVDNLPKTADGDKIDEERLGMHRDDVKAVLGELKASNTTRNLTVSDVYLNAKVPYAYDYADKDTEVSTHTDNAHGTHVAGIIAGKADAPKDTPNREVGDKYSHPTDAEGNVYNDKNKNGILEEDEKYTGIMGVAPLAQLAIFKVFSDMKAGAETEDLIAAVEDCATLGVDVINMSLGSDSGFVKEEKDKQSTQDAYDRIESLGISLVTAGSNSYSTGFQSHYGLNLTSNPDAGSVGSPSTYSAAISVASISGVPSKFIQAVDASNNELGIAYYNDSAHVDSSSYDFIDDMKKIVAKKLKSGEIKNGSDVNVTFNEGYTFNASDDLNKIIANMDKVQVGYVLVPGYGDAANYAGINVRNKIALIQRGISSFEDKLKIAENAGALAGVVYNNVSGIIRMQVGDEIHIPSCSVQMDAANAFKNKRGSFVVCETFEAGPFMSDFSSWGPAPSLEIKPEITAHGGEIYSSVPGGLYDRFSGTSMASPNMAGVVTLMRQHMETVTTETADPYSIKGSDGRIDYKLMKGRIYQLLMSTTTIANNEEGNPYAVRKQGAGLASLTNALNTEAYIVTEKDGKEMDKTKIELGDDPDRKGEYNLEFTVRNIGNAQLSYTIGTKVMTESVSTDYKTVAEKAYMLDDVTPTISAEGNGGSYDGKTLTVKANSEVKVKVKITLSDAEKKYISDRFRNGMYVEGFVTLTDTRTKQTGSTEDIKQANRKIVNLDVPFLAFFGDWADSPMFDIYDTGEKDANGNPIYKTFDAFDEDEDDKDDSIYEDDKRYSTARSANLYGKFTENGNDYIFELGSPVFYTPEAPVKYEVPTKNREYCAISNNTNSIYEIYAVAGFLRGAKTVDWNVVDDSTGDVIYEDVYYNARKGAAIGLGGMFLEMNPMSWGCVNGGKYTINVKAYLDWDDGHSAGNYNTMSYSFYMDSQSPIIIDTNVRVEEDSNENITRYLDLDIFDNHYLSAIDLRLYDTITGEYESIYDRGLRPVSGGKNTTNRVTFDITDYWYRIKQNNYMVKVVVYDTAMNYSWYNMNLKDVYVGAQKLTDEEIEEQKAPAEAKYGLMFGDFLRTTTYYRKDPATGVEDRSQEVVVLSSIDEEVKRDASGAPLAISEITIVEGQRVELRDLLITYPGDVWEEDLVWSGPNSFIKLDKETGEIYGMSRGTGVVYVRSAQHKEITAKLTVKVLSEADKKLYGININGTIEKDAVRGLELDDESESYRGIAAKNLRAGETYDIKVDLLPWFTEEQIGAESGYEIVWSSTNSTVASVTANDKPVSVQAEDGSTVTYPKTAYATVKANSSTIGSDGKYVSNLFANGIIITATLAKRNAEGKLINMPYSASVVFNVLEEYVVEGGILTEYNGMGGTITIPDNKGITGIGDRTFLYNALIEDVTIPEGVKTIGYASFAYCDNLKRVKLPSSVYSIGGYAFAAPIENGSIQAKMYELDTTAIKEPLFIDRAAFIYQLGLGIKNIDQTIYAETPEAPEWYDCKLDLHMARTIGTYALLGLRFYTGYGQTDGVNLENCAYVESGAFTEVGMLAARISDGNYSQQGWVTSDPQYLKVKFGEHTGLAVKSFASCGFKQLEIPMRHIPNAAFIDSEWLTNVKFTADDLYVGVQAFYACISLKEVTFEGSVDCIDQGAFMQALQGNSVYTNLTSVTFNKGCRRIEPVAFAYAMRLSSLELPADLEYVGDQAFCYTAALKTVSINEKCALKGFEGTPFANSAVATFTGEGLYIKAFDDGYLYTKGDGDEKGSELIMIPVAAEVGDYTVPEGVTKIGSSAFSGNSSLTSVKLTAAVTEIGSSAFMNTQKLQSIEIPEDSQLSKIGDYAFGGSGITSLDLTNATQLTTIEPYTFASCKKLTNITLPTGITEIKFDAFTESGITSIVIPTGVTVIEEEVFYQCEELVEVTFHSGITEIKDSAFCDTGIKSLKGEELSGLTKLGTSAFEACRELEEIDLPNVEEVGPYAFCGFIYDQDGDGAADAFISALEKVNLPKAVHLGEGAFYATTLTQIDLPKVQKIDLAAFGNDNSLTTVNIGDDLEEIGPNAFTGSVITSFHIGAKLTKIDSTAFRGAPITEFTVDAANEVYMADDKHVVYRKSIVYTDEDGNATEGSMLMFYPIASEETEYTVKEDTVKIGAYAFYKAENLTKVTLSENLAVIGKEAFNGTTNLKSYKFLSHQAPVLETDAITANFQAQSGNGTVSNRFAYTWQYYAHFYGNLSMGQSMAEPFLYQMITVQDEDDSIFVYGTIQLINDSINGGGRTATPGFGLTMEYPKNAIGFDSFIWNLYFDERVPGAEYLEQNTKNLMNTIDNLSVETITLADRITVRNLRNTYAALSDEQKAFVGADRKTKLDELQAKIDELQEQQGPGDQPDPGPGDDDPENPGKEDEDKKKGCGACSTVGGDSGFGGGMTALLVVTALLGAGYAVLFARKRKTRN